jgi:hypothetical protein
MASPLDLVFGQKPEVAPFLPTDPLAELSVLLGGEIRDWPQIEQLSNMYQSYMFSALEEAVPGFRDILKQGGIDTEALLKEADPLIHGQIPEDVAGEVMRSSAFQSLGAGTLGAPIGTALTARDLGRTSLDLMTQGANLLGSAGNAAQRWAGLAGSTILNPSTQLYSPEWFSTFMAQQRAAQQATKQLGYNVAAAPDPAAAGISGTLMNLLGAYLGHGMGGGGQITPQYNVNAIEGQGFGGGYGSGGQSLGGGLASPGAVGGYGSFNAAGGQGYAGYNPAQPGLQPTYFNDQYQLPTGGY